MNDEEKVKLRPQTRYPIAREVLETSPGEYFRADETFTQAFLERIARQDAAIKTLREALNGLFMRHCDGSDEKYWAEWDTACAALKETEGE